jgi:hypothetical protein
MIIKEFLTNENLRGLFKNNFELSHFAIRLARYYIRAGHEVTLSELFDQIRKNPSTKYLEQLEESARDDFEESSK